MIQLSDYGIKVVNNFNLVGMWLAVLVCCRNFTICLGQYRRTRGKIHLVNLAQVTVFLIHRFLYGIIPLFEIKTCAYFPLLISLWHITYILFYVIMFMRLIILELDQHSRWIKLIGVLLIGLRAADWPYELAFHTIQRKIMEAQPQSGSQCWAIWGEGVIILNFIGDALANLFLSGMFVRRLFIHIKMSKSLMSHHNEIIERIARKSLICLALTFVVNLAMNLLKITMFLGDHSDAFTVYFEIVESTLLVEALRNDGLRATLQAPFCELCHKEISRNTITDRLPTDDAQFNSQIFVRSFNNISNNRNTRYSAYTVDTYDENILHAVSSMEPVLFSEKNRLSLTNSIRYNGDPSVTCGIELNQQLILTQVKEKHIPLPANQSSPRRDSLKSLATEEAASSRLSSSSIITSIPIVDDSPKGSPRLRST